MGFITIHCVLLGLEKFKFKKAIYELIYELRAEDSSCIPLLERLIHIYYANLLHFFWFEVRKKFFDEERIALIINIEALKYTPSGTSVNKINLSNYNFLIVKILK